MSSAFLTAISLVLMTIGSARAQSSSQADIKSDPLSSGTKAILVSGRVSADGKHFSFDRDSDSDSEWNVSNVKALKDHKGSLVTVRCYVDATRNQIQVLSVNRVQPEVR